MSAIDDAIAWKLPIIDAALKQWKDEKKRNEGLNHKPGVEHSNRKIDELEKEKEILNAPPALVDRKKQRLPLSPT